MPFCLRPGDRFAYGKMKNQPLPCMRAMNGKNRYVVTNELVDAPITPNFPSGSSREIDGDYVKK